MVKDFCNEIKFSDIFNMSDLLKVKQEILCFKQQLKEDFYVLEDERISK